MSALKSALEESGISVTEYMPNKTRSVKTGMGTWTVERFSDELRKALGKKLKNHPDILDGLQDTSEMEKLLEEYATNELGATQGQGNFIIPADIADLTLNVDVTSGDMGPSKFFCTTSEGLRVRTSGLFYITRCGISPVDAVNLPSTRKVIPKYNPRGPRDVHTAKNSITQVDENFYNDYIPPAWQLWKERNPEKWKALPAKAPPVVLKLIQHVIPIREEREFFYAWLYTSMTKRCFTYLVLCGAPGVGKNRLKIVVKGLHGSQNTTDGKKETFGANQSRFNSQMEKSTFLWFDELKYDHEMEARMKEYQNETISIERKGVDSTASTDIFCSMAISNNYERDNHITFNSRKFAPLVLGKQKLETTMTEYEIAKEITQDFDDSKPATFNHEVVAQTAKWILTYGPKYVKKWPNLEYQGPAFWKIAHAAMSRWQQTAVNALTKKSRGYPAKGWNEAKGAFLWSKTQEGFRRNKDYDSRDYRDPRTVRAFLESYRNLKGTEVFEFEEVPGGAVYDFWVKPIHGLEGGADSALSPEQLGDAQRAENVEDIPEENSDHGAQLERPPGISQYAWRKMKEEHLKEQEEGLERPDGISRLEWIKIKEDIREHGFDMDRPHNISKESWRKIKEAYKRAQEKLGKNKNSREQDDDKETDLL